MKLNRIWKMLFVLYVCFLLMFVVIKFDSALETINYIKSNREIGIYNYSFSFRGFLYHLENIKEPFGYKNIIGKIIAFAPLGFLLPIVIKKSNSFSKAMLICIISIIGKETFQLITMLGYFDIADILLNTIGCSIGFFGYQIVSHSRISEVKERGYLQ